MKCPYRPITKTDNNITTIEFAECYGKECPWYVDAQVIGSKHYEIETCQKCHMENTQANNERNRNRV